MRIISGKYGGRIIKPPRNFRARPTTDLAKEGLFNILSNHFYFDDLEVLDLFAGTGSVGFEFASREAAKVCMVEKNYQHFKFIKKAVEILQADNIHVIKADFFKLIQKIDQSYDIIFADPPYSLKEFEKVPELILSKTILKPGGWFILEHPSHYCFQSLPGFFNLRNYGSVNFSFFKNQDQ